MPILREKMKQEMQLRGFSYVACLAAYNSGYLHGSWIDAA